MHYGTSRDLVHRSCAQHEFSGGTGINLPDALPLGEQPLILLLCHVLRLGETPLRTGAELAAVHIDGIGVERPVSFPGIDRHGQFARPGDGRFDRGGSVVRCAVDDIDARGLKPLAGIGQCLFSRVGRVRPARRLLVITDSVDPAPRRSWSPKRASFRANCQHTICR